MRFRACFAVFCLALSPALGGCANTHDLQWSIAFTGGRPSGVSWVRVQLRAGTCATATEGSAVVQWDVSLDGAPPQGLQGTVAPGTYAAFAEALDATCVPVKTGCTDLTLPQPAAMTGPVIIHIDTTASATTAACRMCMSGMCVDHDLPDLGPPDMGTTPDMPAPDMPGVDLGGTCNGCTMGTTCFAGISQHACGSGGGTCSDCGALPMECVAGACVARAHRFALSPVTSFLLNTSGGVYSSGDDTSSQRGTHTTATPFGFERMTPAPSGSANAIAATQFATCAIDNTDHTLQCWGTNAFGLLGRGLGTPTADATPRPAGSATNWASIAGGNQHFCGLHDDGSLWCWGDGSMGQLGNGAALPVTAPTHIGSDSWLAVSAGYAHTCAVRDDHALFCWGFNDKGQLGNGMTSTAMAPVRVGTDSDWSYVAASIGGSHTCGIRGAPGAGTLWCWGDNQYGQLGIGSHDATPVTTPTQTDASGSATWNEVSAGQFHTCGVRGGTSGLCWGFGGFGEIGDATSSQRDAPSLLTGHWSHVTASWHWTCGVTDTDQECWGDNRKNQLGIGMDGSVDGGVAFVNTPTPIAPSGL